MNNECKRLLNKLSFPEYKTFIRNALGFLFFNSQKHINSHIVLSSKSWREVNKNSRKEDRYRDVIAYAYIEEKSVINPEYEFVFYVDKNDYDKRVFRQNEFEETIDSYFLNGKLTDSDLFFLMLVSFDDSDSTLFSKKIDLSLKTHKDINNIFVYSFILGSGIDYDYGIDEWKTLVANIERKTSLLSGVPVADLNQFSKERCNTNYYTPQILKDISPADYFGIIRNFLYGSFNEHESDFKSVPGIIDRNLFQICRIVAAQTAFSEDQIILTFNYDDIVEQTLLNSFGEASLSSYKNCEKGAASIIVEHVHGMLPFKGETDNHRKSIVLAHDEYLNNYSASTSYSYSKLYTQLRKRNLIIGNSVADYEEQKVFYNHHKMYLNEFSYALIVKNPVDWLNYYAVVSLYKIGIIPIFFDSYSDICDYLKTIWSPIDDE